jgi:hypothetical protein
MLKFFKLVDGEIVINREEVLMIPSAKAVIMSDKGSIGDADGRKKLFAKKQFGVAWWITDINSPGIQSGFEGKELIEDAIRALDVPLEWDHKNDTIFQTFVADYQKEYNKASYIRLLKSVLTSLDMSTELVEAIKANCRKILKEKEDLSPDDIADLMKSQNEIITIAGNIPKQMEKLKDLQQLAGKEEGALTIGRGGITVTKSMEPNG